MTVSGSWEREYRAQRQLSRWPWVDLVSLVYRFWDGERPWRVLELGCGAGANIPLFRDLGFDYHGIDGSPTIIERLQERFPEQAATLCVGDFTTSLPFTGPFDLIFDRAAITHNATAAVQQCLATALPLLAPGGLFFGVHWFSEQSSYRHQGVPLDGDDSTRGGYTSGPFVGIDPVHFFTEAEIRELFREHEILDLEHIERRNARVPDGPRHTMWNLAARRR